MRDYEELVKQLRSPVVRDDGGDCDACEMLQDDAADAIEELCAASKRAEGGGVNDSKRSC